MSGMAITLKRGGVLAPLTSSYGVGPDADIVERTINEAWQHLLESVSLRSVVDASVAALYNAAHAAEKPNWDGYGARQVDSRARMNAQNFLTQLPTTTPVPDIAIDPDGEIAVTWQTERRRLFSVSVGPNGRLSYAGLFVTSKVHGTEWLRSELPKPILDGIARVFEGQKI